MLNLMEDLSSCTCAWYSARCHFINVTDVHFESVIIRKMYWMWPLVWKKWDDDLWTPLTNTVRTLCFFQKVLNTASTVSVIYKLTEGRHNFVFKSYQNVLHTDGTIKYLTITTSLLYNHWIKLNMSSRPFRSQP